MNIIAQCCIDLKSITALYRLSIFGKHNPKKVLLFLGCMHVALFIIIMTLLITWEVNARLLTILIVLIACASIYAYMYFALPRIQYARYGKMRGTMNVYCFDENGLKVTSNNTTGIQGDFFITYNMISKIKETKSYLFIYMNKLSVYIVDKTMIQNAAPEDLHNLLVSKVPEYVVCHY